MIFLHSIESLLDLILIVLIGYILAYKQWFPVGSQTFLPRLITYVALPPYLLYTISVSFAHGEILQLLGNCVLPFITIIACFAASWVVAKVFRVDKQHFGLFCASFSTSNTVFIGIPVNLALFGEQSLPYVLFYFIANTLFFWVIGANAISRDAIKDTTNKNYIGTIKNIFSPPLLGTLSGFILVMLDFSLPNFLQHFSVYMGNMAMPLAMIFIGSILYSVNLKKMAFGKDLLLALIGRFFISPIITMAIIKMFPIPALMAKVFIIQSSLPAMVQIGVLSAFYKADKEFGSLVVSISTMCALLVIPMYITLFHYFDIF
jgi:malate permease and related proteins